MYGLELSYLIHKLSLWPVVYCQDPTGQRDKAKEVEFGDSPNQELNKIIRFKERRIQKLLCVSQRPLQDVYSVYTTRRPLQCQRTKFDGSRTRREET